MLLKTILNRVEWHKSFVYKKVTWANAEKTALEIAVEPRVGSRTICSGCGCKAPGYDRLAARRFQFVPLWQLAVYLVYAMRRVNCPQCGVCVERVPWAEGKQESTTTFRWFLANWARRLSWREVAHVFRTSWQTVYRAIQHAVWWGLSYRDLSGIKAVGVDEVQWQRGHKYLTLVYQIDEKDKRLLWIGKDRTEETLRGFFGMLGSERSAALRYVCSDMWKPYLKVIAEQASPALHVLDRFHIMQKMNKAIDEVRAAESKRLKQDGYEPVLKHSRWCLLKRPDNLTDNQTVKLAELLKYNLQSVRAYLLREDFQRFWEYQYPGWALRFLRQWCTRTMRSKIEPMKKVVGTLRKHEHLILNWFTARGKISAGIVEGLNNKVKLTARKAYGFRTYQGTEVALYHNLGHLPQPDFTHKFW